MDKLCDMKCEPCRVGATELPQTEIQDLLLQIPNWQVTERDDVKRLMRTFKFNNFADALDFTTKVGQMAEAEAHHPTITTRWGAVMVTWYTHKIRGLHKNDFIMAARTDVIFSRQGIF